jgi:hypothetical protein
LVYALLEGAPQLDSSQLVAPTIGGLVRLLARRPASIELTIDCTLSILVWLASSNEASEQVANAVAGDEAALPALVELTSSAPEDQPAGCASSRWRSVMQLLALVLRRRPQQTEAAFEAGLLDAIAHRLGPQATADERGVASDAVRFLQALLSALAASGDEGASLRLGQLRAAMAQYELVDVEQLRARAMAMHVERQSAASACAACGARAGQPGVRLQMCSRCKQVRYCGPQCQRAHWRAHKAECGK